MPLTSARVKRLFLVLLGIGLLLAGIFGVIYFSPVRQMPAPTISTSVAVAPEAAVPVTHREFVGASACMNCHAEQFNAWRDSHHALAMQEANAKTVLGDFNDTTFRYGDVISKFFKRDGQFFVQTDGPDGKLADFPVKYAFGITPLQQYLIEFPGGRYQALGIAWDTRPQSAGGQRWFHLYPNQTIDHNDQLHWTGRYQNWNMQCAECHSTNLKKNYDANSDSYHTTFSELNVSCEACHGPASQHVEWAKLAKSPYADSDDKGLALRLQSRWQEAWKFPSPDAKFASHIFESPHPNSFGAAQDRLLPEGEGAPLHKSLALQTADTLMNTCWACHARRSTLTEGALPGLPLEDSHHPALLTQPAYYADGQQRDEDYTWGSFRQSKMFRKGVTCLDCHEPHALKLRAQGNALCARCHNAAEFDSSRHHFHKLGSKGAQCIDCHAPEQNYMVIDGRHDHSFRLPRPDLSSRLGSPNACTQCHQNRKPDWAASAMDKWYGKAWRERPHYGTVLHDGVTQGAKALPGLLELAQDQSLPAVVRATAATLAEPLMRPEFLPNVQNLLLDKDPSVRTAALGLIEPLTASERLSAVTPLLSDPVLGVRLEAGRVLADIAEEQIPAASRSALHSALQKYLEGLQHNADWPAENVNLGNLALRQGRLDTAISWYQQALALDARFIGAYVNLADAYRQQGREEEGEKLLHKGLSLMPEAADLHHALGLLLVRKGDLAQGQQELATATELAPDNARYAYVYAVALHSAGKPREALETLKAADRRRPYDLDVLSALISMSREAGDAKTALTYARKAAAALPNDASIKQLITELETAQ